MGHKCFISYKKEDKTYKNYLVELFAGQDVIDKSLDRIIDSEDGDYINGNYSKRLSIRFNCDNFLDWPAFF